jgi:LysR family hca operon transcriptional activator
VSQTAPVLRGVIDTYLKRSGIKITPAYKADHVTMGISLIMSRRRALTCLGTELSPFVGNQPPAEEDSPTVDLVLGYRKSNESPVLKLLLSRLDELVARVSKKTRQIS